MNELISPYSYLGLPFYSQKIIIRRVKSKDLTIDDIISETYLVYKESIPSFQWPSTAKDTFCHPTRKREIVEYRQAVFFLLNKVLNLGPKVSQIKVAVNYCNFDHSTYIHGRETYKDLIETNENIRTRCLIILDRLGVTNIKI